jgi:HEAT repeat protein
MLTPFAEEPAMTLSQPAKRDNAEQVETLVSKLASESPVERQGARDFLVALRSNEVTAALVAELTDPRENVRWEAAKALVALADPVSAPALVHSLEDDSEDIRWLAAEGLIALGKKGLMSVLSALMKRSASVAFCEGAHHVLRACDRGRTAEIVAPVLAALSESEPGVSAPPAAYKALSDLKIGLYLKP